MEQTVRRIVVRLSVPDESSTGKQVVHQLRYIGGRGPRIGDLEHANRFRCLGSDQCSGNLEIHRRNVPNLSARQTTLQHGELRHGSRVSPCEWQILA